MVLETLHSKTKLCLIHTLFKSKHKLLHFCNVNEIEYMNNPAQPVSSCSNV